MFETMHDVVKANQAAGKWFFSPSTMAFFKSEIETEVIGGRFFVTSEYEPGGKKGYTVREIMDDEAAEIKNASEFMAYRSRYEAVVEAERLARLS